MANNEAEIRISANVDSLKQEIKDANSNLKDLRAELKLNEAQFQNTGDKTAYLENKHEILSQMLEESEKKQAGACDTEWQLDFLLLSGLGSRGRQPAF